MHAAETVRYCLLTIKHANESHDSCFVVLGVTMLSYLDRPETRGVIIDVRPEYARRYSLHENYVLRCI